MNAPQFHIWAVRSNGETVYCVESANGRRMVPYAYSMSARYSSLDAARRVFDMLSKQFTGLTLTVSEYVTY